MYVLMTCLSSAAEMCPSLFLSKTCVSVPRHCYGAQSKAIARLTLNASRISSSESVSCIFLAIKVMNSAKSIELLPSAST